ncbi:transcriptional regulator [Actinomyces sp. 565]|uniref:winged helix-turn-helix domain-containing protein n=1 Tax=Actinomyces sp. 565 TaxID=2057794 RepID=UPI0013A6D8B0|nr:transcriptional regulator [Actinomyces sp. 565]NDR53426.1 transcriptional regulator [Actinomyces sp. 565]
MTGPATDPAASASGDTPQHPRHQLVDALMHPVRFSLVAALANVEQVDFPTLRDTLQVSDSVLSRQASQLEQLGIVAIRKGYVGKRPRTWMSLTQEGRSRWQTHLAALQAIAGP